MGNEIENLTLGQVDKALETGGYTDNDLLACEFRGYTTRGAARYEITFENSNTGLIDKGMVFIENVPGVGFVGDF